MAESVEKIPIKVCLEGHASFNQRYVLKHIPEKAWIKSLRSIPDNAYHTGYLLCKDIMSKFRVKDAGILTLSDILHRLPLCLDLYERFNTIESAHHTITSLQKQKKGDHPDDRLHSLSSLLSQLNKKSPEIINQFVFDINNNIDAVLTQARYRIIEENTTFFEKYTIKSIIHPTGRDLFAFILKMLNRHLKKSLSRLGFSFADPDTVADINNIVDLWNSQTTTGLKVLRKFRLATTDSAKNLNLTFGPIEKQRSINPINKGKIENKVFRFLQEDSSSLVVMRYNHISDAGGWNASASLRIPCGAWYLVIALCEYRLLGTPRKFTISPGLMGLRQFDQFYAVFDDATELINKIPVYLPNTIWLLPFRNSVDYPVGSTIRNSFERVLLHHQNFIIGGSACFCVISRNDLGSIVDCLINEDIESFIYDDSSPLWRLWIVYGRTNYAFLTPKMDSLHIVFEDRIKQILSSQLHPVPKTTKQSRYLLEWLGSGEGF